MAEPVPAPAPQAWTARRALAWVAGYLERKGDANPRLSAEWLVAAAAGLSRLGLYTHLDEPLSSDELVWLHDGVARRGAGEPLQYIVGEAGFRHITVKVAPGVLIPRPETEVLVSEALAMLPAPERPRATDDALIGALADIDVGALSDAARAEREARKEAAAACARTLLVADICTGSGCIACSLAHEHPCVSAVATDVAPAAVALARENVDALGLGERVEVLQCDLANAVDSALLGMFDLVVSNPPYVPSALLAEMPREVTAFEPALALDGGPDGLSFFRRLGAWALVALKPGGAFACELHEDALGEAAHMAADMGFHAVRIACDLAGRNRVLTARAPGLDGDAAEGASAACGDATPREGSEPYAQLHRAGSSSTDGKGERA